MTRAVVIGLGVTGTAVGERLAGRDVELIVVEDRPTAAHRRLATRWGASLLEQPGPDELAEAVATADVVLPSPGVADRHPVFAAARRAEVPVASEFDLAQRWDDRPTVAITGTDGKTTVTTMLVAVLDAAGRGAIAAGNTDVPLVAAIDDPTVEVFVVEASSFRLGHSCGFRPHVGAWLNWGPDHLDVHDDLDSYQRAKARIWAHHGPDTVAVANAGDDVVMRFAPSGSLRTFATSGPADFHVVDQRLFGPRGPMMAVADLARSLPHDVANALATWACADALGVADDVVAAALASFAGLPHRVQVVGEIDGVRFVDDSKATVPHAVMAAVRSFDSVVLIAGGRNKGLDLAPLAGVADRVRAVVAIGDAAAEVQAAFAGVRPVTVAADMDEAVAQARGAAVAGDVVLLSPGCASFDWYAGYAERGDDFARAVSEQGRR